MHPKYKEVIELRLQGKSYREIAREIAISKNSISRWCKHLELPPDIQRILDKKSNVSKEKLIELNKRRSGIIRTENNVIKNTAFKEIHLLSQYELHLVGAALYWAEGWKIEKQKGTPRVCFVNSDPYMVSLFARFLREVLRISDDRFNVCVHIYPNMDKKSAIEFWSRVVNLSYERFRIVRQVSRASSGKRPRNSLPFGTLKMNVSGRREGFRIKGWIDALKSQSGFKN